MVQGGLIQHQCSPRRLIVRAGLLGVGAFGGGQRIRLPRLRQIIRQARRQHGRIRVPGEPFRRRPMLLQKAPCPIDAGQPAGFLLHGGMFGAGGIQAGLLGHQPGDGVRPLLRQLHRPQGALAGLVHGFGGPGQRSPMLRGSGI